MFQWTDQKMKGKSLWLLNITFHWNDNDAGPWLLKLIVIVDDYN